MGRCLGDQVQAPDSLSYNGSFGGEKEPEKVIHVLDFTTFPAEDALYSRTNTFLNMEVGVAQQCVIISMSLWIADGRMYKENTR